MYTYYILSINMVHCQDMPYKERKRQYAALRRAILKKNNPALTAKFSLCSDGDRCLSMQSVVHTHLTISCCGLKSETCTQVWDAQIVSRK